MSFKQLIKEYKKSYFKTTLSFPFDLVHTSLKISEYVKLSSEMKLFLSSAGQDETIPENSYVKM